MIRGAGDPARALLLLALLAGLPVPGLAQAPAERPAIPSAAPPVRPASSDTSNDSTQRPPQRPAVEADTQPTPDQETPTSAAASQSQGRLIPPEEMPPPEVAAPPVPVGPPMPEQLRESDFDHAACRLGLTMLGARYTEPPAITDPAEPDCGIARPVAVSEILPGIALDGAPPMRCDTARALARWMRGSVLPATAHLSGAPRLTAVRIGTGYHCRGVVGQASAARLSEHALGNAIDIAGFDFEGGQRLDIAPVADRGDLVVAVQNAVQATACLFFTTVLGPGSNTAHDDHLHLDIKARNGGFRLCQ